MLSNKLPFVSIIVPVRNGEKTIAKCIESLSDLDYPDDKYEILVIDNNSKDRTRELVGRYPVILLEEKRYQSPYAARNTGIRFARGEVLAFIDAGEYADRSWLKKAIRNLKDKIIVGGHVAPILPVELNIVSLYDSVIYFRNDDESKIESCDTGNMVCCKDTFNCVGLFIPYRITDEDTQWSLRAKKKGYRLCYEKDAVVYKYTQTSWHALLKRAYRKGKGSALISCGESRYNYVLKVLKCLIQILKCLIPGFRTYCTVLKKNNKFTASNLAKILILNSLYGLMKNLAEVGWLCYYHFTNRNKEIAHHFKTSI